MGRHVSVKERFLGFAVGHIAVSAIAALIFWVSMMLRGTGWAQVLLMLLYVPAGYVAARAQGWGWPEPRQGALAVLLPALAAWAWAFGGWAMVRSGSGELMQIGMVLLLSTALLASPSFVLMLLVLIGGGSGPVAGFLAWYGAMVLAGLLPPLLFFAGTLTGARPRRNKLHSVTPPT